MTSVDAPNVRASRAALFGALAAPGGMPRPISRSVPPRDPKSPRGAIAARTAANKYVLQTGDASALEQQIIAILAAGTAKDPNELRAGEKAPDGSIILDSMNAVFVLSIVKSVVGRKGWANLRTRGACSPEDFRSARALARLIERARPGSAVAA